MNFRSSVTHPIQFHIKSNYYFYINHFPINFFDEFYSFRDIKQSNTTEYSLEINNYE